MSMKRKAERAWFEHAEATRPETNVVAIAIMEAWAAGSLRLRINDRSVATESAPIVSDAQIHDEVMHLRLRKPRYTSDPNHASPAFRCSPMI